MLKWISIFSLFICLNSFSKNLGHRAGGGKGEFHSDLPENSLLALKASLLGRNGNKPIQFDEEFHYLEFDIQETADGEVVIFHDKHLTRMLPESRNYFQYKKILSDKKVLNRMGKKKAKLSDLRIKYLTLYQLKKLSLNFTLFSESSKVPTLEEFLNSAMRWNLKKPIAIDIKYINTKKGRYKVLETIKKFKIDYMKQIDPIFTKKYDMSRSGISFISFPWNFKSSFGKKWCSVFKKYGHNRIYRAQKHSINLCK